jgi:hypothetical protein
MANEAMDALKPFRNKVQHMRFEVLEAINIKITVFGNVTPGSLVDRNVGTYLPNYAA